MKRFNSHIAVAAVDLGASSGRVMLGRVGPQRLDLFEAHRFPNAPLHLPDGLHWDIVGIYREIITGLRAVADALEPDECLAGIGIDSWGVDVGLIDAAGSPLGLPWCYRDSRHQRGVASVHARIDAAALYRRNGLQHQAFNTVFQLAAAPLPACDGADDPDEAGSRGRRDGADDPDEAGSRGRRDGAGCVDDAAGSGAGSTRAMLLPDLLGYWLTGQVGAERTNASTTGLLDIRTGQWATDLIGTLGLPPGIFPQLREPGDTIGQLLPHVAAETTLPEGTPVLAVASHDTASAVAAVPADSDEIAFVSCGTWSLVGVELAAPVLTEASRLANFTNEGGVDGTVRYLRNVTGLWLLQESMRSWERDTGVRPELRDLLAEAGRLPTGGPIVDSDDATWLPQGNMPERIRRFCASTGRRPPDTRAQVVRCIHDSLAAAHARAVTDVRRCSGRRVGTVHVVGGGSRNELLAQLTADACGLPVVSGPAEATALGNVLVQARALGVLGASDLPLSELRALVRRTQPLRRFVPAETRRLPGA